MISISTGAPQGCVLSANLFTIYEADHDFINSDCCMIMKYADDTVIVGLLNNSDDCKNNEYVQAVASFSEWCKCNYLDLNIKKTKEMIIDFRTKKEVISNILIGGQPVEIVHKYKYLGTIIDDNLSNSENVQHIVKRANKRMYFV